MQRKKHAMKLTNEELDRILEKAGLRMAEPYSARSSYRKDAYLFTQCTTCGIEAHYKLKYILGKSDHGEKTCRVCHWLHWYDGSHALQDAAIQGLIDRGYSRRQLIAQGVIRHEDDLGWEDARVYAEEHGFELIDLIHGSRPGDDVLVTRCTNCGRYLPHRPIDVSFGCPCRRSNV